MLDNNDELFMSSRLFYNNNNFLWSKLYHGIVTKDIHILCELDESNLNSVSESEIINLITYLPRDLNGFNLYLKIKSNFVNEIPLFEFLNGKIFIEFTENTFTKLNIKNCAETVVIRSYDNSKKETVSIDLTVENVHLLILENIKFNESSKFNLSNTNVETDNVDFKFVPPENIMTAYNSNINVLETCTIVDEFDKPMIKFNKKYFSFNECQVTLLPNSLNELISDLYLRYTDETTWKNEISNIYTDELENSINNASLELETDFYYNFINHIHTVQHINEEINNSEILPGTLIMYPMCFKILENSPIENPQISSLIQIPDLNEWRILHTSTNETFNTWIENKFVGTLKYSLNNLENIFNNFFIVNYEPLDLNETFLNLEAQFTTTYKCTGKVRTSLSGRNSSFRF